MSPESINPTARESKEKKLPPVHFDFFFAPHRTAEDSAGLDKQFQEADIFVMEYVSWSETTENIFRDVSYGRISPEEANRLYNQEDQTSEFVFAIFKMIYKSFKPIIFVDYNNTTAKQMEAVEEERRSEFNAFLGKGMKFERILAEYRQLARKDADDEIIREDHMMANLPGSIQKALETRPDLMSKKELKALMFLGAYHTRVYRQLGSFGQKVSRKFNQPLIIFPFEERIQRSFTHALPVSNADLSKALLERLIFGALVNNFNMLTRDTNKLVRFFNKVISSFEFDEIRDIFNQPDRTSAFMKVNEYFKIKNLRLPGTEEELDKYYSN